MPTLQDVIYSVVAGKGARFLKALLLFLAVVGVTTWYNLRCYKNFYLEEAMDNAQIARNIAEGKGFTTQFIRPFSIYLLNKRANQKIEEMLKTFPENRALWTIEQQQKVEQVLKSVDLNAAHPDVSNPPVYPVVISWLMSVLPFDFVINPETKFLRYQPELLIAIFNQILFFMAVWMTFSLASRLFEEAVGWLTVIVLLGSELMWKFTISGLPTILLMNFFLLFVWCLVMIEKGGLEGLWNPIRMVFFALLAGVIVGTGTLTIYRFAIIVIPALFFIGFYSGPRRGLLCSVFLIGFIAVVSPWIYRNYELTGAPLGAATYSIYEGTSIFQGSLLQRSLNPDFTKIQPTDVPEKLWTNLSQIIKSDLPFFGGSWVGAFFITGLLFPFRNVVLRRLRQFTVFAILCFVIVQALGKTHLSNASPEVNSENILILLSPLVFMFGCSLFYMLLEQVRANMPELKSVFLGTFAIFMCLPLLIALLFKPVHPVAYPPYYPPRIYEIGSWMERNELVMSDIPWAVAWYGNRHAIWLTSNSDKEYEAINAKRKINALYLTSLTLDTRFLSDWVRGEYEGWGMFILDLLLKREVPTGFPLNKAPTGFFPEQLFLSDKERWIQ